MKHGRFILAFLLSFSLFFTTSFAETIAGWEHQSLSNPNSTKKGVLLGGNSVIYSSPAVADLDGNPENGLETAVATSDGTLNVVDSSGNLLWTADLPNHNCNKTGDTNKVFSTPAIGELFKDGRKFVVVGYGGIGGKDCGGGVVAHFGDTGKRRWHFNLVKFSKKQNFAVPIAHSVFSSPVIQDVNKDGFPEIAFGSYDRNVYVLNSRGKPVWYYNAADTVWSSGTFANVDGKGKLELIIGTDITENNHLNPPTKNGGFLYAFKLKLRKERKKKKKKKNRGKLQHFHFQDSKAFVWRTHFSQVIHSSPSIGDILPDTPGLEIAIGSGCFFPESTDNKVGKWVKILSLSTGKVLRTLKTNVCVPSSPALADIDEDGKLEVVVITSGSTSINGDGNSRVTAWNPEDSSQLWETIPTIKGNNDAWAGHFQSAIIADLDGNGSLEVVSGNSSDLVVLEGKTGKQLSCAVDCDLEANARISTGGIIRGAPTAADINNDGKLELIIGSKRGYNGTDHGVLFGWQNLNDKFTSLPGTHPAYSAPWAAHQKNAQNNSILK